MRVLMVVLALLLTLIVGVISLSYLKSHGQPYSQEIDAKLIPIFTPASLDFVHVHDESALPMIASAIIDIDGDLIPELFLGGGRHQPDAVFRYTETGFVAIEGAGAITKDLADASYGAGTIDVDNSRCIDKPSWSSDGEWIAYLAGPAPDPSDPLATQNCNFATNDGYVIDPDDGSASRVLRDFTNTSGVIRGDLSWYEPLLLPSSVQ